MGGSCLAPDVLNQVFGSTPDWLMLRVLDSTDPAAVAASGRPRSARDAVHHRHQVRHDGRDARVPRGRVGPDRVGARREDANDISPAGFVIGITDPGASLEAIPHNDDLREVFLNPPDVGGRYSALTYVGLVPAALIGLDLDALLGRPQAMAARCRADRPRQPGCRARARARRARARAAATS